MHVIVSTQGFRRWISGVVVASGQAEALRASLPQDARIVHEVRSIYRGQFPLFILETASGFTFLDPVEAARAIAELPPPESNAGPILFAILSEYRPEVAGRDEMGRLRHVHLDEAHLAQLRKSGPLSLAT